MKEATERLEEQRPGERTHTQTEGEQMCSPSVAPGCSERFFPWMVCSWASEFSTDRSGSPCLNAVLFPGSFCFRLIDAHVPR